MVQSRGPETFAVTMAMLVACTAFIAARFFTRVWIVRKVQLDDWVILLAWLIAVGFSVSICYGTSVGLGRHDVDIPVDWHPSLRKAEYAFSVLYNPALMATKTSIIVFFLGLSKDEPVFKWCNYLTLLVTNVAGLALTFLNIFQCRPIDLGFVYPTPAAAKCTDIVTLYLSSAPVNIITDLAVLFIPMPILTRLRLPKKQKIILVVTFSIGAFVAVVDVVRIAYLQNAALERLKIVKTGANSAPRIQEENDFPWDASLSFMWSAVEVNVGIICACVPSLKPLFLKFLPGFIKDVDDIDSLGGSFDQEAPPGPEDFPDFVSPTTIVPPASLLTNPAAIKMKALREKDPTDEKGEMGFLDFLAGPPPEDDNFLARTSTNMSRVSTRKSASRTVSKSQFDFFDMNRPKSMLKLTNRESFRPVGIVTVIFFLWGFAYGLLSVLNAQFETVVTPPLTEGQKLGLPAAYYGGYLIGPLTLGRFILKTYGFKAVMMAGLCVYACGTLVFWPAAVLTSYTAFVISNFIVGFGLSCLEIAANPFIALCGPMEYAEVRLNFSQGFQAIGTVVSQMLATKVMFRNVLDAPSLIDVQWTYLGIALFDVVLAVVFYYINLPEASDEDLEDLALRRSTVNHAEVGGLPVIWLTCGLGVFAQWCYVGGQECIGSNTSALVGLDIRTGSTPTPFDYITIGHTVFAAGRFFSAFLNYVLRPRWILLFLTAGLVLTSGLSTTLTSNGSVAVAMLTFFFESGVFSIIFAMTIRGMGAHTKTASSFITAAISGGAIFPVFQHLAQVNHGLRFSFVVPAVTFGFGLIYPIYLNLVPAAQAQVDPVHEQRAQRRANRRQTKSMRRSSYVSDPGDAKYQFGLAGILARRKNQNAQKPTTEHVERTNGGSSSSSTPEHLEIAKSASPLRNTSDAALSSDLSPWSSEANKEVDNYRNSVPLPKPSNPAEPPQPKKHNLTRWPSDSSEETRELKRDLARWSSKTIKDEQRRKPSLVAAPSEFSDDSNPIHNDFAPRLSTSSSERSLPDDRDHFSSPKESFTRPTPAAKLTPSPAPATRPAPRPAVQRTPAIPAHHDFAGGQGLSPVKPELISWPSKSKEPATQVDTRGSARRPTRSSEDAQAHRFSIAAERSPPPEEMAKDRDKAETEKVAPRKSKIRGELFKNVQ